MQGRSFSICSLMGLYFSQLLVMMLGPWMIVADGYNLNDMGISAEMHDQLSMALARAAGVYHRPESSERQSWLTQSYPRLNRTVLVTASNYGYVNHLQVISEPYLHNIYSILHFCISCFYDSYYIILNSSVLYSLRLSFSSCLVTNSPVLSSLLLISSDDVRTSSVGSIAWVSRCWSSPWTTRHIVI